MDKLQMAHEYAKIIIEKILCGDIDNIQPHEIASDAFDWADAMQAEADKREKAQAADIRGILAAQSVKVVMDNELMNSRKGDDWQPDWSVAPSTAKWWSYYPLRKQGLWHMDYEEPQDHGYNHYESFSTALAPSFNYEGDWKDSLRKRPCIIDGPNITYSQGNHP